KAARERNDGRHGRSGHGQRHAPRELDGRAAEGAEAAMTVLSRRTMLQGLRATIALPLLDAMLTARSGFGGPFHNTSHHSGREDRILDFAKLNTFHVGLVPYFLEKLRRTPDEDGTLLDNTLLIYGSPMGDSNLHNHKHVPFFIA